MKHPASNGKATKDMDSSTTLQKGGSSPSTRHSGAGSKVSGQDDMPSPATSRKGSLK